MSSNPERQIHRRDQKAWEKERIDYTKKRDEEVLPVMRELFKRIAARIDTLKLGSMFDEEQLNYQADEMFDSMVSDLLINYNLRVKDVTYLFQILMQPIQLLADKATNTMHVRRDQAESKRWGIPDKDDIRVLHVTNSLAGLPLLPEHGTYLPAKAATVDKSSVQGKK